MGTEGPDLRRNQRPVDTVHMTVEEVDEKEPTKEFSRKTGPGEKKRRWSTVRGGPLGK